MYLISVVVSILITMLNLLKWFMLWSGNHKKEMSLDSVGDQVSDLQAEQVAWQPLFQYILATDHLRSWNEQHQAFFLPSLQISPWLLLNTFLTAATIIFVLFTITEKITAIPSLCGSCTSGKYWFLHILFCLVLLLGMFLLSFLIPSLLCFQ